jgi:hypothetical protein
LKNHFVKIARAAMFVGISASCFNVSANSHQENVNGPGLTSHGTTGHADPGTLVAAACQADAGTKTVFFIDPSADSHHHAYVAKITNTNSGSPNANQAGLKLKFVSGPTFSTLEFDLKPALSTKAAKGFEIDIHTTDQSGSPLKYQIKAKEAPKGTLLANGYTHYTFTKNIPGSDGPISAMETVTGVSFILNDTGEGNFQAGGLMQLVASGAQNFLSVNGERPALDFQTIDQCSF